MNLKEKVRKFKNDYVINQVKNLKLPDFEQDNVARYRITFSGRVQKIGFRLEVCELAKRLGLTGFCRNLENGDVLAELQGAKNKIDFLILFMESLKRIKIENKVISEIALADGEKCVLRQ